jgi:hypothetical protein
VRREAEQSLNDSSKERIEKSTLDEKKNCCNQITIDTAVECIFKVIHRISNYGQIKKKNYIRNTVTVTNV